MGGINESLSESPRDHCSYPGCMRPRLPDPATGRPTRYCGQADEDGGQVHNRATAFKARRAQQGGGVLTDDEPGVAAPVSMARATLDQRLAELPTRFTDLRQYLDGVVEGLFAKLATSRPPAPKSRTHTVTHSRKSPRLRAGLSLQSARPGPPANGPNRLSVTVKRQT